MSLGCTAMLLSSLLKTRFTTLGLKIHIAFIFLILRCNQLAEKLDQSMIIAYAWQEQQQLTEYIPKKGKHIFFLNIIL